MSLLMQLMVGVMVGVVLGVPFVLWDKWWVRREEARDQRRSIEHSAIETYISMRERKHSTMREMRRVAREYHR